MKSLSRISGGGQKTDFLAGVCEPSPTRVVIVDDEENDRCLLRLAVEKSGEFVCVGAYGSAHQALAEIPNVCPQVVLMDVRMAGMDGHECTWRLKVIMEVKIIIVTGLLDVETMNKSLQAGADGYLTKPVGGAQFLAMLKLTARDRNGWRGRPARLGRRPADRNSHEQRCEKAVAIGSNFRSRSVRSVAGRHRRVACVTSKPFFKHALRLSEDGRSPVASNLPRAGIFH